ncbi:MAG: TRAP transporter small permease [Alcaligenaceae bacterium]|nr:TRAP transporter small permease [Alcaligenaceae bacterium]
MTTARSFTSKTLGRFAFLLGAVLVLVSVLTGIEVVCRNFFGFSLEGVDEISAYALAGVSAWGFVYALLTRSHIRIDSLIQFAGGRLRAWLDIMAYTSLLIVAIVLAYYAWGVLGFSIEHLSRSQTPLQVYLWIPQSIWVAGLLVFVLAAAVLLVRACHLLLRGRYQAVTDLLNVSEIQQEMEIIQDRAVRGDAGDLR